MFFWGVFIFNEIKQIMPIYLFPMEVEDLEDLILPRHGLSLHGGKLVLFGQT